MDTTTKQCLLQVIGGNVEAEQIMLELGAFAEEESDGHFLNRKRIMWLHKHSICGAELVQYQRKYGGSSRRLCEKIDRKRRKEANTFLTPQQAVAKIHQLASQLTNDDRRLKDRLLGLSSLFPESVQSLLQLLELLYQVGLGEGLKSILEYGTAGEFRDALLEEYKRFSIVQQNYNNALLCADAILSIKLLKRDTLTHIKTYIQEKLGADCLHTRSQLLLSLLRHHWQGALYQHCERLYQQHYQRYELLPAGCTTTSLTCYILLCAKPELDSMHVCFYALSHRR